MAEQERRKGFLAEMEMLRSRVEGLIVDVTWSDNPVSGSENHYQEKSTAV